MSIQQSLGNCSRYSIPSYSDTQYSHYWKTLTDHLHLVTKSALGCIFFPAAPIIDQQQRMLLRIAAHFSLKYEEKSQFN